MPGVVDRVGIPFFENHATDNVARTCNPRRTQTHAVALPPISP